MKYDLPHHNSYYIVVYTALCLGLKSFHQVFIWRLSLIKICIILQCWRRLWWWTSWPWSTLIATLSFAGYFILHKSFEMNSCRGTLHLFCCTVDSVYTVAMVWPKLGSPSINYFCDAYPIPWAPFGTQPLFFFNRKALCTNTDRFYIASNNWNTHMWCSDETKPISGYYICGPLYYYLMMTYSHHVILPCAIFRTKLSSSYWWPSLQMALRLWSSSIFQT